MTENQKNRPNHMGLGVEDLEQDHVKPDFDRGSGGEPRIQMPDGTTKRYARMSSFGDTLDEKSGLTNWLTAKALEGAAYDQSILARVIASSPYEDHKADWTKLREDAIQMGRGSYKADRGTAVHAMSERWEQESDFDPPEPYRKSLQAYSDVMDALGLVSELIECNLVNDTIEAAGTADRLYKLTKALVAPDGQILLPGTLIIGDLKTGTSLEFSAPGYAVQLGGYAGGVLYDVENNVRIPTPTFDQRWAIIMHLDVETAHCEFIWVDLEVGRFGARLAEEVREWRRAWRRKGGYKASMLEVKVADAKDLVPDDVVAEIVAEITEEVGDKLVAMLPEEPVGLAAFHDTEHPEPQVEVEASSSVSKPIWAMNKKELVEEGERRGIEIKSSWNKPEMLATLDNRKREGGTRPTDEEYALPPDKARAEASEQLKGPFPDAKEDDLPAWVAWLEERLQAIRTNREALDWMMTRWPKGELQPPKRITTMDEVEALDKFVGRVEAQFGLPFVTGQPSSHEVRTR